MSDSAVMSNFGSQRTSLTQCCFVSSILRQSKNAPHEAMKEEKKKKRLLVVLVLRGDRMSDDWK